MHPPGVADNRIWQEKGILWLAKEWELLFNLSAKQNSNFSSTFKAAQSALVENAEQIQQLNKVQSDITAYQKQQQAVDSTKQRLAVLQQQYDNIQKEIQETEGYSSALENKLITKQAQIDKTTTSLHTYEQRLAASREHPAGSWRGHHAADGRNHSAGNRGR